MNQNEAANNITLNTANGEVVASQVVDVYVHDLGMSFEFYVLPNVRPLLSMGILANMSFEFTWRDSTE